VIIVRGAMYAFHYKTNQPIDTIESSELRHDHWDG
jgi:hypothetical protein